MLIFYILIINSRQKKNLYCKNKFEKRFYFAYVSYIILVTSWAGALSRMCYNLFVFRVAHVLFRHLKQQQF